MAVVITFFTQNNQLLTVVSVPLCHCRGSPYHQAVGKMDKISDGCLLKTHNKIIPGHNVDFFVFKELHWRSIQHLNIIYVTSGLIWMSQLLRP